MESGSAIESSEVTAGGVLEFLTQIPADVFDVLAPVAQAAVVCRAVPERLRTLDTASAEAVLAVAQRAMNVLSAVQDLALAACVRREELDLADLDGDWADGSEYRPSSVKIVASSVAPILRSTPRGAESRVSEALCLVEDLPRTLASALDGRLTQRQTGVMVNQAGLVAVDARPAFEAVLMEEGRVESLTSARLRRECERAAMAIDPAAVQRRSEHGLRDRFVRVEPGLDSGTTWWKASLPSRDSMQAWGAVDELAHEYVRADPARSIDQARADAFLDLLLGSAQVSTTVELVVPTFIGPPSDGRRGVALRGPDDGAAVPSALPVADVRPSAPPHRPRPPEGRSGLSSVDVRSFDLAQVVGPPLAPEHVIGSELFECGPAPRVGCDADPAAAGPWLAHQAAVPVNATGPAEDAASPEHLLGRRWRPPKVGVRHPRFGWMLAPVLAEVLSDPDVVLRVTRADALTGVTVARDPSTYRPNAALAQRIRDRDRTCRFPGCGVAARRCDLDHVVRYPDGSTSECNLVCLCRTHHGFKHHAGWTLTMDADGTCTWTSPTGRSYVTRPADVRLDAA